MYDFQHSGRPNDIVVVVMKEENQIQLPPCWIFSPLFGHNEYYYFRKSFPKY